MNWTFKGPGCLVRTDGAVLTQIPPSLRGPLLIGWFFSPANWTLGSGSMQALKADTMTQAIGLVEDAGL